MPFILAQYRQDAVEHVGNEILAGRLLKDICTDEGMPPLRMVTRWLATNEVFRAYYTECARAVVLSQAYEAATIVDEADPSELPKAKLQAEIRLKAAKLLLPELRPTRDHTPPPASDRLGALLQAAGQGGHGLPKVAEAEIVEEES